MNTCHCKRCFAELECKCGKLLDSVRGKDRTHALVYCEKCSPFLRGSNSVPR